MNKIEFGTNLLGSLKEDGYGETKLLFTCL